MLLTIDKAPTTVNADAMTAQLRAELLVGYEDMVAGNVQEAQSAFKRFRESRQ